MFEPLPFDRHAVAARLREILDSQPGGGDLPHTATRLGVPELTLRLSVDERSPHPGFETIAAMVRLFGVDPHWLVSGEYDGRVHRAALEMAEKGSDEELQKLLRREMTTAPSWQQSPSEGDQASGAADPGEPTSPAHAQPIAHIRPETSLDPAARIPA